MPEPFFPSNTKPLKNMSALYELGQLQLGLATVLTTPPKRLKEKEKRSELSLIVQNNKAQAYHMWREKTNAKQNETKNNCCSLPWKFSPLYAKPCLNKQICHVETCGQTMHGYLVRQFMCQYAGNSYLTCFLALHIFFTIYATTLNITAAKFF